MKTNVAGSLKVAHIFTLPPKARNIAFAYAAKAGTIIVLLRQPPRSSSACGRSQW
jgi:hypothetical protein